MTPDPYDHVREAFHTVADGLMGWQDPPSGPVSRPKPLRAYYCTEDIGLLERAGEAAMRAREIELAVGLFALALKIRQTASDD